MSASFLQAVSCRLRPVASQPVKVRVAKSSGCGRGLFAVSTIGAGTEVVCETAVAFAAVASATCCAACGADSVDSRVGVEEQLVFCERCGPSLLARCLNRLNHGMVSEGNRLALALVVASLSGEEVAQRIGELAIADQGYDPTVHAYATEIASAVGAELELSRQVSREQLQRLAEHGIRGVLANAFGVRRGSARMGSAVYLAASAINHACDGGSAAYSTHLPPQGTPQMVVRALRETGPGEEVRVSCTSAHTIRSTPPPPSTHPAPSPLTCSSPVSPPIDAADLLYQPTDARRLSLRRRFGFDCICPLCSTTLAATQAAAQAATLPTASIQPAAAAAAAAAAVARDVAFEAVVCCRCAAAAARGPHPFEMGAALPRVCLRMLPARCDACGAAFNAPQLHAAYDAVASQMAEVLGSLSRPSHAVHTLPCPAPSPSGTISTPCHPPCHTAPYRPIPSHPAG